MARKSKGELFIDKNNKVHANTENGVVITGLRAWKRRDAILLKFKLTKDGRSLLLIHGRNLLTSSNIRKDRWVTKLNVPEEYRGKCDFLY